MKQIAIYGGTFNVLHDGHKAIIRYLSKHFDKVLVIPTNVDYYRTDKLIVKYWDRRNTIWNYIQDNNLCNVEVSDIEHDYCISRFSGTLKYLLDHSDVFTSYTLAMGSDTYNEFKTWYNYQFIKDNVSLLVFSRPGYPCKYDSDIPAKIIDEFNFNISSTELLNKGN